MEPRWLDDTEMATWLRLVALVELLPGALDSQLQRDSQLSHYEYFVLAILSEAPERTLRMSELAERTNASLARLSHVVRRLERRGLIERSPDPDDARATNARLTDQGRAAIVAAAPGHVANVREQVMDALSPEQIRQLGEIADRLLTRLDPGNKMTAAVRGRGTPAN